MQCKLYLQDLGLDITYWDNNLGGVRIISRGGIIIIGLGGVIIISLGDGGVIGLGGVTIRDLASLFYYFYAFLHHYICVLRNIIHNVELRLRVHQIGPPAPAIQALLSKVQDPA
ncbi:hypothetical protein F8M41_001281 [Gigaspora margarita]|uniref:Uncharacterized protein n=1 Tax=Gigaspora margarita TaxID=4874 RepID=A0A8H4EVC9_GIGMA|nr:hypothetical protein F8M41_001281 [Gigaspora margarita]